MGQGDKVISENTNVKSPKSYYNAGGIKMKGTHTISHIMNQSHNLYNPQSFTRTIMDTQHNHGLLYHYSQIIIYAQPHSLTHNRTRITYAVTHNHTQSHTQSLPHTMCNQLHIPSHTRIITQLHTHTHSQLSQGPSFLNLSHFRIKMSLSVDTRRKIQTQTDTEQTPPGP
jgi:hypothetical protein